MCLFYWIVTGRFHPLFVVTLYYNQVVGAAIKIFASYHPDRQKWTRQQAKDGSAPRMSVAARLSTPLMLATASCFVLIAVVLSGAIDTTGPGRRHPTGLLGGADGARASHAGRPSRRTMSADCRPSHH